MVLRGGRPLFHGTLLPHAGTLSRLLENLATSTTATGTAGPPAMAAAVWRLGPQRLLPPLAGA
jgi:hypothetical protein